MALKLQLSILCDANGTGSGLVLAGMGQKQERCLWEQDGGKDTVRAFPCKTLLQTLKS